MVNTLLVGLLGISPVLGFIHVGGGDGNSCLHGGVFYASGAPVPSEELCENCECNAGEVTCTVQKCRAPRYNCRPVGFVKGTCCPLKFECDNEIDQIRHEIPFTNSDENKFRNAPVAKSCTLNGQEYFAGQSVPVFSPCQTGCACVDGSIACVHSACDAAPPAFLGCTARKDVNECCPEYDCSSTRNTINTLKCEYKGISYEDGEFVPNSDQCSDCYCLDGDVVCANQECPDPPAENCTPVTSSHQSCCPQKYECSDIQPQVIDTAETTEIPIEKTESTTTNGDVSATTVETTDEVTSEPFSSEAISTDSPVDANEVTETTQDPDKEQVTTTEDDFTTPTSVESTQKDNGRFTTASIEHGVTYCCDDLNESTTMESMSITETTPNSNTDGNDKVEDGLTTIETSSTDRVTEEVTTEQYTTEDDMVTETTTMGFVDMCSNNGNIYTDGESIPPISQCQESCQCRNGTVSCIEKACSSTPPAFLRCAAIEVVDESDECCPTYDCPPPSPGPESPKCVKDGIQYYEGEFVPSVDLCTDCYCLYGEILCAFLECAPPVRDSCYPIYDYEKLCCPEYYECDIGEGIQTTTAYQTEEPENQTTIMYQTEEPENPITVIYQTAEPDNQTTTMHQTDEPNNQSTAIYHTYEPDNQSTTMYQTEEADNQSTTMYQTEEPDNQSTIMYQTEEPKASANLSLLRFWL